MLWGVWWPVARGGVQVTVSFAGVDVGRVEATVKALKASDAPFLSGLEASAANGEGFGIEIFRPMRNMFQVRPAYVLPMYCCRVRAVLCYQSRTHVCHDS